MSKNTYPVDENIVRVEEINDREHHIYFLGALYCKYHATKESAYEEAVKRQKAYDLIPDGSKIIRRDQIKEFDGKFIGGILTDSIMRVYGTATHRGIPGCSCSVYFIPSDDHLKSVMSYGDIEKYLRIKI